MVKRSHGFRQGTRNKLKKSPRTRGKLAMTKLYRNFELGNKVAIKIEPSFHKGMPHPKYQGKTGIIFGKRKNVYEVHVKDGGKIKTLLSAPVHLSPLEE